MSTAMGRRDEAALATVDSQLRVNDRRLQRFGVMSLGFSASCSFGRQIRVEPVSVNDAL